MTFENFIFNSTPNAHVLDGIIELHKNIFGTIASKLMEKQYQYLKGKGYKIVQTKTMNR